MASSDYSGLTCGNSLSEVLKIAGTELRELQAHYRTVTQRIRKLRIVVDALGELGRQDVAFVMGANEPSSERAAVAESTITAAPDEKFRQVDKAHRKSHSLNPDLRRACRIALLEAFETVSIEEVYKRIVRRGSFHFADADSAMSSIAIELNALVEDGELSRIERSSGNLWQRKVPATEPVVSVLS